ncbi:MAG: O-antigen ligase family protein [Chromatiaceae bacterium]|nr:O-antigen ligase family protein [Chromatiaceae bacterium]
MQETLTIPVLAWAQIATLGAVAAMLMLMMGGVYPGPRALAGASVATLFFGTWAWRILQGEGPTAWDKAWFWVWAAVTAWIALQLLPLPRGAFQFIGAYPPELLEAYPEIPVSRLSPNIEATIGYWGMFTTYWAAAYLTAQLPRQALGILVAVLVGLVFAEALYGFVAHAHRLETVLGLWPANRNHHVVLGTFWNRNHLAGLIAVLWPLAIAYLLFGVRTHPVRVSEGRYLMVVILCIVLALALFNTQSRLGTAAALFGLLVFTLLARAYRAARVTRLEQFWLALAAVIAIAMAVMFGLVPLLTRYLDTFEHSGRLDVLIILGDLPIKTWLFGAGAGGFHDVFKLVQPPTLTPSYYYLHNDWVQFLLEFGVLGVVLVLAALIPWWLQVRPSSYNRLRAGAAGGVAAIALHSLGDFNLQIPGTAFAFWLTLGVLVNRDVEERTVARKRAIASRQPGNGGARPERRKRSRSTASADSAPA